MAPLFVPAVAAVRSNRPDYRAVFDVPAGDTDFGRSLSDHRLTSQAVAALKADGFKVVHVDRYSIAFTGAPEAHEAALGVVFDATGQDGEGDPTFVPEGLGEDGLLSVAGTPYERFFDRVCFPTSVGRAGPALVSKKAKPNDLFVWELHGAYSRAYRPLTDDREEAAKGAYEEWRKRARHATAEVAVLDDGYDDRPLDGLLSVARVDREVQFAASRDALQAQGAELDRVVRTLEGISKKVKANDQAGAVKDHNSLTDDSPWLSSEVLRGVPVARLSAAVEKRRTALTDALRAWAKDKEAEARVQEVIAGEVRVFRDASRTIAEVDTELYDTRSKAHRRYVRDEGFHGTAVVECLFAIASHAVVHFHPRDPAGWSKKYRLLVGEGGIHDWSKLWSAGRNPRIVSCSWSPRDKATLNALKSGLAQAVERDAIVMCASGNTEDEVFGVSKQRSLLVEYIQPYDGFFSVAGASWQTTGDVPHASGVTHGYDLVGDDGKVTSVPDFCGLTRGLGGGSVLLPIRDENRTEGQMLFDGSSAATPQLAGLCALVLGIHDGFSSREVGEILREASSDITDGVFFDPARQKKTFSEENLVQASSLTKKAGFPDLERVLEVAAEKAIEQLQARGARD